MATAFDSNQCLTAMVAAITAFSSCTGVTTAAIAASMAAQVSADTSLTAAEKVIITQVTSAIGSATPSTGIHSSSLMNPAINSQTLFGAMTSILVAISSASCTSTATTATAVAAQQSADTGLSKQSSGLLTNFITALGVATPSATAHSAV